ncbi:glycosyltransferase [Flavobacterium sp. J49]|uniref:glycosyltransferase family 2 protein n=1 Tax=Flavobacterium sp. J49 TaxID=2718534 RepID=UPI001592B32C|nr:glycosyltransferase family 2 protein [Flavobacterium sp. J49]MBF6641465.1 glycosyltransferase [Flavobacterium sp. J49]NIC02712.1 glycosyltransferase [Flavobacterium sp. J49]
MENNTPFFTVITASYNSGKTIADTISSVLNQSFTDFEFIIVDGKSSDNTMEIVKSFAPHFQEKNITFKFVSEKDRGIYDAWNKGIKLSQGTWISFLGSDDEYLPNALERYFFHLKQAPDCNYISSQVELTNTKKEVLNVIGKAFVWEKVVRNMEIAQVGSFHHKQLFENVGLFNDHYKIVGDLEFYIRCKPHIKPAYFEEITAKMLNEGVSNQIYKALKEALDVKLKHKSSSALVAYFDFTTIFLKCHYNKLTKKK